MINRNTTSRGDPRFNVQEHEQSSQEIASQLSRASGRTNASDAPSLGDESELSVLRSLQATRLARAQNTRSSGFIPVNPFNLQEDEPQHDSATTVAPIPAQASTNRLSSDFYAVLGDLIDLGILNVTRFGQSPSERQVYILNNFESVKQYLNESVQDNLHNPLLQYVMNKAALNISEFEDLIANIFIDSKRIKQLNLSGTNVVDQLPFYIRSFFPELENKDKFLKDTAWMKSKIPAMQQRFEKELEQVNVKHIERLLELHKNPAPRYDTVCIGRGNNMTKYWEFMPNKKMQSILFIGKDSGIWCGHSQLAQTSGILENEAETAASNYNPELNEAFGVSHVEARQFYQSLVHSQNIHDFPGIVGEVLKIEADSVSGYKIEVAYNLAGSDHTKTIRANKLTIGTGLSDSRNVFYQKGQFYMGDFEPIAGDRAPLLYRSLAEAGYFQLSGKSLDKIPQIDDVKKLLNEEYADKHIQSIVDLIDQINNGRMLTSLLSKADYERLATFDDNKGFTPIVDGNAFILSDAECSQKGKGRSILAYGGGGTAAASIRRGLFLKDSPSVKETLINSTSSDAARRRRPDFTMRNEIRANSR